MDKTFSCLAERNYTEMKKKKGHGYYKKKTHQQHLKCMSVKPDITEKKKKNQWVCDLFRQAHGYGKIIRKMSNINQISQCQLRTGGYGKHMNNYLLFAFIESFYEVIKLYLLFYPFSVYISLY